MDFETKYFTLDEAEGLLPVLETLLKRVIAAKRGVEEFEATLQELNRRILMSGGMFLDVERVREQRAAYEAYVQEAKDSLAEIDAMGVQVKDIDTGLLDFPCLIEGQTVLLCWKMGESRIGFWHTLDAGFRGRQPLDARFEKQPERDTPDRPN